MLCNVNFLLLPIIITFVGIFLIDLPNEIVDPVCITVARGAEKDFSLLYSNPTRYQSWTRAVGCQVVSKSLTSDPFKSYLNIDWRLGQIQSLTLLTYTGR